jgi:thiol:disulfide interchange protein
VKPGLRVTAIVAAALLLAGAAAGSPGGPEPAGNPWLDNESVAFEDARASGRHVVVVFGADWCLPCKKIDQIMNGDIVFGLLSESFVPLHFDITELSEHDEALQAKYRVPALPAVIFVGADGRELGRWKNNLSARGLIAAMQSVVASHPLPSAVSRR